MVVFSCYATLSYVISLRGNEGFLLDLDGMSRHTSGNEKKYFIVALQGKIKGETNEKSHLVPCANITSSGIDVKKVVVRLLKLKERMGFRKGPAVTTLNGKPFKARDLNDMLLLVLEISSLFLHHYSLQKLSIEPQKMTP